jgi:hypothetical protein
VGKPSRTIRRLEKGGLFGRCHEKGLYFRQIVKTQLQSKNTLEGGKKSGEESRRIEKTNKPKEWTNLVLVLTTILAKE